MKMTFDIDIRPTKLTGPWDHSYGPTKTLTPQKMSVKNIFKNVLVMCASCTYMYLTEDFAHYFDVSRQTEYFFS